MHCSIEKAHMQLSYIIPWESVFIDWGFSTTLFVIRPVHAPPTP